MVNEMAMEVLIACLGMVAFGVVAFVSHCLVQGKRVEDPRVTFVGVLIGLAFGDLEYYEAGLALIMVMLVGALILVTACKIKKKGLEPPESAFYAVVCLICTPSALIGEFILSPFGIE
jgi:hypothetical protein